MNITIDIVEHYHLPDGSHAFAGEVYYDQDQLLCEFLNPGMDRRWQFEWESREAFLRVFGEATRAYPKPSIMDSQESIKEWILNLLVKQEAGAINA